MSKHCHCLVKVRVPDDQTLRRNQNLLCKIQLMAHAQAVCQNQGFCLSDVKHFHNHTWIILIISAFFQKISMYDRTLLNIFNQKATFYLKMSTIIETEL